MNTALWKKYDISNLSYLFNRIILSAFYILTLKIKKSLLGFENKKYMRTPCQLWRTDEENKYFFH